MSTFNPEKHPRGEDGRWTAHVGDHQGGALDPGDEDEAGRFLRQLLDGIGQDQNREDEPAPEPAGRENLGSDWPGTERFRADDIRPGDVLASSGRVITRVERRERGGRPGTLYDAALRALRGQEEREAAGQGFGDPWRRADYGNPGTWTDLERKVGEDAAARLYAVSGGNLDQANAIHHAYARARVDAETGGAGERTLVLAQDDARHAPFRARLVMPGDRFGRNDSLTHDDDAGHGPMVEFYDTRYDQDGWSGRGQFVSRYYTSALDDPGMPAERGLVVDSGSPSWRVSAANLGAVRLWAMEETGRRTAAPEGFFPPGADQIEPAF